MEMWASFRSNPFEDADPTSKMNKQSITLKQSKSSNISLDDDDTMIRLKTF